MRPQRTFDHFGLHEAVIACVLFIASAAFAQSTTQPTTREAMHALTGEKLSEFWRTEARKLNRPFDEFIAGLEKEVGTMLLVTSNGGLLLSYKLSPLGDAIRVDIGTAYPQFTDASAAVIYTMSTEPGKSSVMYSAPLRIGPSWHDYNADGVFDLLGIWTDHDELLNLDRGSYILLKGVWTRAERDATMPPFTYRVGTTSFRFDATSGRWVSER